MGTDPGSDSDPVLYDVRLLLGPLLSSSSSSSGCGGNRGHSNANGNGNVNISGSGDGEMGDMRGVSESKSSEASPIEVMVHGVIREEYECER